MARPRTVSDDDVLAAAAAAVAAVGPSALTLAEVGARAGLSPATLVQRFGSKRGLLLAVARHSADAFPRQLREACDAPAPVSALIEVLTAIAGGIQSSAEFANHLAFLLLDLTDPAFQQVTRNHAAAVEAAIADVLARGRDLGELRDDDASDALLPRAVHAAYNGALVTWGMTGEGEPAEAVRHQLRQLLAHRLSPSAGSRTR